METPTAGDAIQLVLTGVVELAEVPERRGDKAEAEQRLWRSQRRRQGPRYNHGSARSA